MKKRVNVAVGVIIRDHQVFVSKRHAHLHQGGKWEFPGGKIEANETGLEALCRELKEELGIDVLDATSWMQISHDYVDKDVFLDVYLVTEFSHEPRNLEGQVSEWASLNKLASMAFPKANDAIVTNLLAYLSE